LHVADLYAEVVGEAICRDRNAIEIIKSALSSAGTIEDAVEAIMEHAQFAESARFSAAALPVPWLSSSFQTPLDQTNAKHFLPAVEAARKFLSAPGRTRVFFVQGDPYSGKKTVLRHFIEATGKALPVENMPIPVFAASCADLTSEQLIDQVFRFYLALPGNKILRNDLDLYSSLDWKLGRIRSMAKRRPACVLLADTDQSESDHTFGSISQDCSVELVGALVQGNPDTRLLLTAAASAKTGGLYREALLHGAQVATFDLKGHFPISDVLDRPSPALAGQTIDGKTWKFALITKALSRAKKPSVEAGLIVERERCIAARDLDGLAALVWNSLLSPLERILLGLISISHDGMRTSVLLKLIAGLDDARADLMELPELSATAVDKALSRVGDLLHKRVFQAEPALVRAGYLDKEPIHWLDHDWRRRFLELWWGENPTRARKAHWLVAREAADQSRRLRVYHLDTPATSSFGRDVQALHALIASVDPAMVASVQDRDVRPLFNLEGLILPPLELRSAKYPDPAVVLRYCLMNLYRRDIEGKEYQLLTVQENAHARMSILLPMFSPSSPWMSSLQRVIDGGLEKYSHLTRAFEPAELIDLLAGIAIAAERLQRYELVAACSKLGRQIVAKTGIGAVDIVNYMRLLRSQIDGHLFLGRANANAISGRQVHGGWLDPVPRKIEELLSQDFAPSDFGGLKQRELVVARGKLFARLGEAYHILGKFHRANIAFNSAVESEEAALALQPVGSTLAPVLGGRGARRQIRLLLELARRRSCPKKFLHFIFADGTVLPAPVKVRVGVAEYRAALSLHDINARRSHRGRAEDAVGLKIDAARLAAARHEFGAALEYLDLADENVKLASGVSAELILEFYAVRARLLLDGCVLCLIANAPGSVFESRPQLADLGRYLGTGKEAQPSDVADLLAGRVREAKARLDGAIGTLSDVFFPYATYSRYVEGVLLTAESRLAAGSPSILEKLTFAQHHIAGAVEHMLDTGYRMHLFEAQSVQHGLNAAIAHYSETAAA
jgi:hypothetical protein